MNRPRIQWTLRSFLFLIAVVAVNCWAVLRLDVTKMHGIAPGGSYPIRDWRIGLWPFANGVVLAAWLAAARRSWFWAGAAFVGVHVVVVGWIFFAFTTELSTSYLSLSEEGLEWAAVRWIAAFGSPDETVPWLVASCLILGGFLSGPPLLLMGVGGALARRCARTLPATRFRATAALVSLGFAMSALSLALWMDPFVEDQDVTLEFRVVEEGTGRPIQAANVRIVDALELRLEEDEPIGVTNQDGIARLSGRFPAEGERNVFRTLGNFGSYGRWLEVDAPDHRALRVPLSSVIGPEPDLEGPGRYALQVARGEATAGPFEDVAGDYSPARLSGYFSGGRIKLEPDGRFACPGWSGHGLPVYGFFQRDGAELEGLLLPLPREWSEESLEPFRMRPVRWGSRLYLCGDDEEGLREFCRSVLEDGRPPMNVYVRNGDEDAPPSGLPTLPLRVWASYVLHASAEPGFIGRVGRVLVRCLNRQWSTAVD